MTQAKHVLFYSNKCKFCNDLLSKVKNIKDIEQVCIDNMKNIPVYVKGVPGLLVDRNDIIYGAKVFEFVKKMQEDSISAVNSQMGDYSFIEDSNEGLSNGYTYIDEDQSIFGDQDPEQVDENRKEYNDPKLIDRLIEERNREIPVAAKRV